MDGQTCLKQAKVLCIGTGGLGCPVLQYLVAAGVGTIGMVDHDQVSVSNLHRQILFDEVDIGKPKVHRAQKRLSAQNPHINLVAYSQAFDKTNAETLVSDYDIVVDGSDNYKTRYLLNDVTFFHKKPLVSASIFLFQGQVSVFNYEEGPCYRCLYPEPPPPELSPNCNLSGVLGVLPGIVGTIQATEVIKLIIKKGRPLSRRLLQIDALTMQFKEYAIKKHPDCPLCCYGKHSDALFIQTESSLDTRIPEIEPQVLAVWLADSNQNVQLIDVREPYERSICNIGGHHIPSTQFTVNQINLDKQKPIVVYCKSGNRSQKIGQLLKAADYPNIYSLKGGILAWIKQINPELFLY
jgi:sulfur-carrier protein adenylyltransferase/sulfurtransferase